MKKKMGLIFLIVILISVSLFSERISRLPELTNPTQIAIGHNQIYFADGTSVCIYSLKDHKLLKKIGREGDGPQEFKVRPNQPIRIILKEDGFYVSSQNKISQFNTKGEFIKEFRNRLPMFITFPMGNKFVGKGFKVDDGVVSFTVNIYDSQFKIEKELYREESEMQPGNRNKFDPIDATGPEILVAQDNIFILTTKYRNSFQIFSSAGELLHNIENISKPIPMTAKIKEGYIQMLKIDPRFKRIYERLKDLMVFKNYLPLLRNIMADNSKILAITYADENRDRDIYIFGFDGKLLKKVNSPLVSQNIDEVYPFTFYKDQLFQVLEKDEEWELHSFVL